MSSREDKERAWHAELARRIREVEPTPKRQAQLLAGFCFLFLLDHAEEYRDAPVVDAMKSTLFAEFPWLENAAAEAARLEKEINNNA